MRFLLSLVVVPVVLAAAACSAVPAGDVGEEQQGFTSSKIEGGCSASRAAILSATSPARRQAIERGFTWLDGEVPYSQSAQFEGFRTDCSGFVSMCWDLGQSYTTADFVSGGGQSSALGGYEDLLPADALVHRSGGSGHVVLFLGWDDAAHSGACVLEQASTASDMQFRVRSTSSLESGGYIAIRADALANDTSTPAPAPAPTPAREDPDFGQQDPAATPSGACVPARARVACTAAAEQDGIECGFVSDGCGGEVSCAGILDCKEGLTCGAKTANRCGKKASTAAIPSGDVGDDGDAADESDEEKPSKTKKAKKAAAASLTSGGCSASPTSSTPDVAPLLAVVLAASMMRRRSRRAAGAQA